MQKNIAFWEIRVLFQNNQALGDQNWALEGQIVEIKSLIAENPNSKNN